MNDNIRRLSIFAAMAAAIAFGTFGKATIARAASPTGRLIYFGVAYDAAPPDGKTVDHYNYAPDNFSDLLVSKASPLFRDVRLEYLKGAEVTRDGVLAKLAAIGAELKAEDVVFFYWGTHGAVDPRKGWNAGLANDGVIYGADIKRELRKFPCPVIAVVSTCGSGGFARQVSPADAPLPENVTALCACRRRESTGNDLDASLCEALTGFADFDNSGEVTVREAMGYVPSRYSHWYPGDEESEQRPVLVAGKANALLDAPLVKVNQEYAAVVKDGRWYGVSVIGRAGDKVKVRFLGYDRTCADGTYSLPDEEFAHEALDMPGGEPPVEVEWQGSWWPAKIIGREGDAFRIHYVNYPKSDDETVEASRVRFPFPSEPVHDLSPTRGRRKR